MPIKPVLVLGDVNVDMLIHLPNRSAGTLDLTQLDLTRSVPQLHGGGTAGNTAVALARLGVPVRFVGAIGDDGYGRWLADDFIREGIEIRGLRTLRDAFTPMVMALIEPNGERMLVVWPPERGADTQLRPEDVTAGSLQGIGWLHTTGMCLRHVPVCDALIHAMRLAHDARIPVSIDLNLRLELWGLSEEVRRRVTEAIDLADVVFGNAAEEIAALAGLESIEAAAQRLSEGKRVVVARLGAQGVLAATPTGIVHSPAFPAQIVDTLGAGDAFDGGFIAAQLAGEDVQGALRWGNAVAALKLGRTGARGSPRREEVLGLLEANQGTGVNG